MDYYQLRSSKDFYRHYIAKDIQYLWDHFWDSILGTYEKKNEFADYLDQELYKIEDEVPYEAFVTTGAGMGVLSLSKLMFFLFHGFVDVIRIGEGARKRTFWGFLEDGLRLVTIISGAGGIAAHATRAGRMIRLTSRVRFIDDIDGPLCYVRSGAKALVHSGHKNYIRISDLVADAYPNKWKSMVKKWNSSEIGTLRVGTTMDDLVDLLKKIGFKVNRIKINSMDELKRLMTKDGSIGIIKVKRSRKVASATMDQPGSHTTNFLQTEINDTHAFTAFFDKKGHMQFMDGKQIFTNLDDLAKESLDQLINEAQKSWQFTFMKQNSFALDELIIIPGAFPRPVHIKGGYIAHVLGAEILGSMSVIDKRTNASAQVIAVNGDEGDAYLNSFESRVFWPNPDGYDEWEPSDTRGPEGDMDPVY